MMNTPFTAIVRRTFCVAAFLTGVFWVSETDARHHCDPAAAGIVNVTFVIIRHPEKPEGGREGSSAGVARAESYAIYFNPFKVWRWSIIRTKHTDRLKRLSR